MDVVNASTDAALQPGLLPTDRFQSSFSNKIDASIGMSRSRLPFDWSIASQYQMENSTQLARHYRVFNMIGEVTVPVARTIAIVTSGGYEKTKTSERSALVDATGNPVTDSKGRFIRRNRSR